jgi:signal peptidase
MTDEKNIENIAFTPEAQLQQMQATSAEIKAAEKQANKDAKTKKTGGKKEEKKGDAIYGDAIYKVSNSITSVLVALLVVFAALLVVPRFVGIDTYVVLSGSMEPVHKTGGLIYTTRNVDTDQLEVGDVITFKMSETTIATHRVIDIKNDGGTRMFQTKGDANPNPDQNLVPEQNVIGKSLFSIPYMGYAANYIQNPPGLYYAAGIGIILVLLTFISDLLIEDDSKSKSKKKKKKNKKNPKGESINETEK